MSHKFLFLIFLVMTLGCGGDSKPKKPESIQGDPSSEDSLPSEDVKNPPTDSVPSPDTDNSQDTDTGNQDNSTDTDNSQDTDTGNQDNSTDTDNSTDNTISVKLLWDNDEWTKHIIKEIQDAKLENYTPQDISNYCPSYTSFESEKKFKFWAYLMSAMAWKESLFNTDAKHQESFIDSSGDYVVSRGLFQLSIESSNQSAYGCNLSDADELHDPLINISCATNILSHWIREDNSIGIYDSKWLGGARYWAVLRTGASKSSIMQKTNEFCSELSGNVGKVDSSMEGILKLYDGYTDGRPEKKDEVISLQEMLINLGYDIVADGYYGNATSDVVAKFQQKYNFNIDGDVVTKDMFDKLKIESGY